MTDHYSDDDEARRKHFKPKWFLALLRSELGLGETFWIGGIGAPLVSIPIFFFLMLIVEIVSPASRDYFLLAINIVIALYLTVLLRAVAITAIKNTTAGIWRWVAIIYSALNMLGIWYYVLVLAKAI